MKKIIYRTLLISLFIIVVFTIKAYGAFPLASRV